MEQTILISDAAKKVNVEAHVLRYWEEELDLPIKRNELGHRYYTEEDVKIFQEIRELKERGLQLKAIRLILKNGKLDRLTNEVKTPSEVSEKRTVDTAAQESVGGDVVPLSPAEVECREEKAARLQWLLKQLFREVLQENNEAVCQEMKESILKEMDYQFRMQEEREEERHSKRLQADEEHFKRIDELLRKKRGILKNKEISKKS